MSLKRLLLSGAVAASLVAGLGTPAAIAAPAPQASYASAPAEKAAAPAKKTRSDDDKKTATGSNEGSSRIGGLFGSSDLADSLVNIDSIITKLIGVIFVMTAVF